MINMTNFQGRKAPGRDYSTALRDMLPSLLSVPMSKKEIAKATERDYETVSHLFAKIRDGVHVAGWRRGRDGPIEALWLYGPGEDAPKPAPLTSAEKSARSPGATPATRFGRSKATPCGNASRPDELEGVIGSGW